MSRWGPAVIVLLLLAATAVAFATTERQKLEKTPLAVMEIDDVLSPACRCAHSGATIALRFRRTHVLTVQIRNGDGRVVSTLTHEVTVRRGVATLRWNGRDARGRSVPDGEYSVRFILDDGRTFDPPNPIRVDSTPPRATVVAYRPRVLRRPKSYVSVRYRVDEPAHPILYVNGRREILGVAKALTAKFDWFARPNGRRLPPGRYRLQLAAVDLAGNVGARTKPFVVRIRR
jgi:hypothetical protein